jgi:hypothetical protein
MKELKPAIIRTHQKGIPKLKISRLLDIPLTTVYGTRSHDRSICVHGNAGRSKDEWPSNSPDLNPMDYSV